jgi:hypothetical protein
VYFLFSGEGPTDFGLGTGDAVVCEGESYMYGPMAVIVDQIVEAEWQYSLLESPHFGFIRKRTLVERASELKNANRKSFRIPGKKKPRETAYFYENSRMLALCATEKEVEVNDRVIAVLFRDSDGTAAAGRGLWKDKRNSMIAGFRARGVRTRRSHDSKAEIRSLGHLRTQTQSVSGMCGTGSPVWKRQFSELTERGARRAARSSSLARGVVRIGRKPHDRYRQAHDAEFHGV